MQGELIYYLNECVTMGYFNNEEKTKDAYKVSSLTIWLCYSDTSDWTPYPYRTRIGLILINPIRSPIRRWHSQIRICVTDTAGIRDNWYCQRHYDMNMHPCTRSKFQPMHRALDPSARNQKFLSSARIELDNLSLRNSALPLYQVKLVVRGVYLWYLIYNWVIVSSALKFNLYNIVLN